MRAFLIALAILLSCCCLSAAPQQALAEGSSAGYVWPLRQNVGWYEGSYTSGHKAVDICGVSEGTEVIAMKDGVVKYTQTGLNDPYTGDGSDMESYGNMVLLYHEEDGCCTLYAHLSSVVVSPGQRVYQGDTIGRVGNTGYSVQAHLHFELRTGCTSASGYRGVGTRVNPLDYVSSHNLFTGSGMAAGNKVISMPADESYLFVPSSGPGLAAAGVDIADAGLFNVQVESQDLTSDMQMFRFRDSGDGTYCIVCTYNNVDLAFCAEEAAPKDGVNVCLVACEPSDPQQQWFVESTTDGYISFRNVATRRYLDISGGNIFAGTNIRLWAGNGTAAQKYDLFTSEECALAQSIIDDTAAFPAPEELTSDDLDTVWPVRARYKALTDRQKTLVDDATKAKLDACVAAVNAGQTAAVPVRLAGAEAPDTSAAICEAVFADGSCNCAVLCRDDDFADAMSASGLAGALDCPIVLTNCEYLSDAALAQLERVAADKETFTIYIIGGHYAMDPQIGQDLREAGFQINDDSYDPESTRIWGTYAADTSVACANAIMSVNPTPEYAVVAISTGASDALSMSSFAYKYQAPIILLYGWFDPGGQHMPDEAVTLFTEGALVQTKLFVAGGPGAIKPERLAGVRESIADGAADLTVQPDETTAVRLWGMTGYDTSEAIAEYLVANGLLSPDTVCISSGTGGLDALSGAALGGKASAPMLLANTRTTLGEVSILTVDAFVMQHAPYINTCYVLGGTYVMPPEFVDYIQDALTVN